VNDPEAHMIALVVRLAGLLPSGAIQALAQTIGEASAQYWTDLRLRASQAVPQPHVRALVLEMLGAWQQHAPDIVPTEIALVLRTAAAAISTVRDSQAVELVWSGPLISSSAMRRTDQALLQLITSAQQSLLIVSFAVCKIPAIAAAIVQAAARDVTIRICAEAPEPSGQKMAYDTLKALGPQVAQHAAIYVWPSEQRPADVGLMQSPGRSPKWALLSMMVVAEATTYPGVCHAVYRNRVHWRDGQSILHSLLDC